MEDNKNYIGTNIKKILEAREIDVKDFASKLKLTVEQVEKWFLYDDEIPIHLLPNISSILNVSYERILNKSNKYSCIDESYLTNNNFIKQFKYHLPIFLKNQIDCDNFEKDIETFENYIITVNPRFKYNKHYLSNYVNELRELYSSFDKKEKIYENVFNNIIKDKFVGVLYLDTILFDFYDDKKYSFNSYTSKEFDSNQIIGNKLHIDFIVITNNAASSFSKIYPLDPTLLNNKDNKELDDFIEKIITHLKSFLESIQS